MVIHNMSRPPKIEYVASMKRDPAKYAGSRIIAWATNKLVPDLKACSHLCIILRRTLVIESTLGTGVRIIPYTAWAAQNRVVYSFERPYEGGLSKFIPEVLHRMWGKKYDKKGIAYFTWRMILFLGLNRPLPKNNPWESPDQRFCVEIFGRKKAMTSPIQLVQQWTHDPKLIRREDLEE